MNLDRTKKIVSQLIENNITAYEVAQNTTLTAYAVQKIKDGDSKKPRESTLKEIENFLQKKLSNELNFKEDDISISELAIDVYKNWNRLMEEDIFKEKIDNLVKDGIILKLQEIINKND
ncbi:hypothetical protein [Aquimarina longa]|uniref:hypothetical protein n=1 Tax=Aquimarina longa TaxID=1080221 RepID=UPI00078316A5|nr:hypothetical protein [Aquimarina longa]